ncbi:MAG: hypothetical protein QOE13_1715 [Gaiellaceae bacterium]|nr:hypothetical protein [Gaiellaceae bacterium]
MTDVIVYGATAAGTMAAATAASRGAKVTLVGPDAHVGGMVSGGLSWTDVGRSDAIRGLTRAFYEDIATHYEAPLWGVRGPEPHVAERLLEARLGSVDVRLGEPLAHVTKSGARITKLETSKGKYEGAAFVDASYEGDLMAGAGVPYTVGRESREQYGETWAGRQPASRPGKHNFSVLVSPFADDGSLLPHIREPDLDDRGWPLDRLGEGDGGLQAYGFRICLMRNGVPFERPDGYEPTEFELLRRYLHATEAHASELLGLVPDLLPNGKCDVNSIGPFSLNVLDGSNRAYPDGDTSVRERVRAHHLLYTQSLLWFLSQDDDVPLHVQEEMRLWGLCTDEFSDSGGWPHQLYVRDGRRMLGEYVLRESDLMDAQPQEDTVAFGSYNIDIREIERTWRYLPEYVRTAAVFNEGYLSVEVPTYPIPLRSLRPRQEDCDNLLVPVCVSASHVAFGSVRMEPTLMMLGEAAGAAAAICAKGNSPVQNVVL